MRTQGVWRHEAANPRDDREGLRRAQIVAARLADVGERLTVTTPAQSGPPAFARQENFLPQPILPTTLTRLQYEGVINVSTAMTTDFVCAGEVAISIGDLLGLYDGAAWKIIGLLPESYAGVTLLRHAIAQRQ